MRSVLILCAVALACAAGCSDGKKAERETAQRNICINNMKLIDCAKVQACMEGRIAMTADGDNVTIRAIVNEYIDGNTTPVCRAGGAYKYGTAEETETSRPKCNIPTHVLR